MNKHFRTVLNSLTGLALCIGTAQAQTTTTYSGGNGNWNNDSWNQLSGGLPQYWDNGIPTGAGPWEVVIGSGWHASATEFYLQGTETPTPAFTGNVTLQSNAKLELGQSSTANDMNALGTGTITMNTGSDLRFRRPANTTHTQNLILNGPAKLTTGTSSSAHHRSRNWTGTISGGALLTVHSSHNNTLYLSADNSGWSGGLLAGGSESESKSSRIEADAANSLGTGNITMHDGDGLQIDAANAMGDSATVTLQGRDGSASSKLQMNASDTIGSLVVNSDPNTASTMIGGSGTLTVNTAASVDLATGISTTISAPLAGGATLTKTGDGTLNMTGTTTLSGVNVDGGTMTVSGTNASNMSGTTTVNSGGNLELLSGGVISGSTVVNSGGTFEVDGGTIGDLTVNGNFTLANAETPTGSIGTATVEDLTMGTGVFQYTMDSNYVNDQDYSNPDEHYKTDGGSDMLTVTGTLDLGTAPTIEFNVINLAGVNFTQQWVLFNIENGPGDYSSSFDPNIFNYTTGGSTTLSAEPIFSLLVDAGPNGEDLIVFQIGAFQIPEPSTMGLYAFGGFLIYLRRRNLFRKMA